MLCDIDGVRQRQGEPFLIFHAFAKKTQKTPQHEIALAQKRLKEMLDEES